MSLHCYGGRVGGFRNSAVPLRRRNAIAPLDWASIIGSKARESRIRTRGSGVRSGGHFLIVNHSPEQ